VLGLDVQDAAGHCCGTTDGRGINLPGEAVLGLGPFPGAARRPLRRAVSIGEGTRVGRLRIRVDRLVYTTITLMSVLIIYDGWMT
jgi:hypothetical protein